VAGSRTVDVEAVATQRAELLEALFVRIGVRIELDLAVLALTHRSFAYENGGLPTNERLEFLGDAVLGLCITDALYTTHPDYTEGQLAKLRASIVNMNALAGVARGIGLGELLRLGKGEERTDGRNKASLLADALEALIGAVYSEHGLEPARGLVLRLFDSLLTSVPTVGAGLDWKTSLQELTASQGLGVPSYRLTESGPDHAKEFTATAVVAGEDRGSGSGRTKKEAEQKAAALAYQALSPADVSLPAPTLNGGMAHASAAPVVKGA
jgi:ribonuclease-3